MDTGKTMFRVDNLKNSKGRSIENQFVINYDDPMTKGFQSYRTMVAVYDDRTGMLTVNEAYRDYRRTPSNKPVHSHTTTRNLNIWLRQYTPWNDLREAERQNRVIYEQMYVG